MKKLYILKNESGSTLKVESLEDANKLSASLSIPFNPDTDYELLGTGEVSKLVIQARKILLDYGYESGSELAEADAALKHAIALIGRYQIKELEDEVDNK